MCHRHIPCRPVDVDRVESHQDEEEAVQDQGAEEIRYISSSRIETLALSGAFPVGAL
jgi:hypothetical protein